jgi:hypothetical protein
MNLCGCKDTAIHDVGLGEARSVYRDRIYRRRGKAYCRNTADAGRKPAAYVDQAMTAPPVGIGGANSPIAPPARLAVRTTSFWGVMAGDPSELDMIESATIMASVAWQ